MAFIRKIKKKDAVYLAEVESYREDGKVKQRVIRYLGKEVDGKPEKKVLLSSVKINSSKRFLDYYVLDFLAKELTLDTLLGEHHNYILLLVYTQIISRKSIYQLPDYVDNTVLLELLKIDKLVDKNLYKALDWLDKFDFKEIEDTLLKIMLADKKERKALVLDVTDTYFNGKNADWKKRKGKDGKVDKLIQIALAVTQDEGFPILHKMYEGNIGNTKVFSDLLKDIRLTDFDCIILDRGMISHELLNDLKQLNQEVITGLRTNNKIKREFLDQIKREEIFHPSCGILLKNTHVFYQSFDYLAGKLIVIYNPEMENVKMEKLLKNPDSKSKENVKYFGYSLLYHSTKLSEKEVIKKYFEKDIVEKAYRELKTNIHLNPVRKYRMNRVSAHIKICYLAYAIMSFMQNKLKDIGITA
ncbi:hypothetical protein B0A58_12740, partial [Flavobacterium branchiophilum NBRC 15030 = ATCC 35035]